MKENVARRNWT